eukprot:364869-Chlamydomonas_euryale.AAC.25
MRIGCCPDGSTAPPNKKDVEACDCYVLFWGGLPLVVCSSGADSMPSVLFWGGLPVVVMCSSGADFMPLLCATVGRIVCVYCVLFWSGFHAVAPFSCGADYLWLLYALLGRMSQDSEAKPYVFRPKLFDAQHPKYYNPYAPTPLKQTVPCQPLQPLQHTQSPTQPVSTSALMPSPPHLVSS